MRPRADDDLGVDAAAQVTFLFTDLEGSTRRWRDDPEGMSLDLTRHFDAISVAVEQLGGTVVQDTGDGLFAAFPNARDAVAAAVRAQRHLAGTTWAAAAPLRVRMGLHTGMADAGSRQYRGTSVNRCARVMDAAHGGQILVSEATWAVLRDEPPAGIALRDLGEHRLKDMRHPERLFQVTGADLEDDFPPPRTLPDEVVACPYKGLAAFHAEDADRFFGRERLVDRLVASIAQGPFMAVIGASGSGKSSAVRAGLLPRLAAGGLPGSDGWTTTTLTPGEQPLDTLAHRIARLGGNDPDAAASQLATDPSQAVESCLAGHPDGARLVVVVDQFEEVFTLCRDDVGRDRFVDVLLGLAADEVAATVVIVLRADFYGACADHPALAAHLPRNQVLVGPMDRNELRAAITGPARAAGLRVEESLVEEVVEAAAGETGGLPLVSHALVETWARRDGDRLTRAGYRAAGGVEGAIAATAETVYRERLDRLEQAVARRLLLRMVEPSHVAEDTRRPAELAELRPANVPGELVDDVLDELIGARLVTVTEATAELAHEALIREWPTLQGWLDEDRDAIRFQRHLTSATQAWADLDGDQAELYRGARLATALDLLDAGQLSPSQAEREFLEASRARAERTEREARRRTRRLQLLLAGTVVGLVVAVAASIAALQQRQDAQSQRAAAETAADEAEISRGRAVEAATIATARQLAAAADAAVERDPEQAVLLAMLAVRVADGTVPEVEGSLHRALQASRVVASYPGGQGVALAPDGTRLVTTSSDGPVHVYDRTSGDEALTLVGHEGRVTNVDVSDDGARIASTGFADGTLRLWDATTGEQVLRIDAGAPVLTPTFSPDGRLVAAPVLDEHGTRVWDVATGEELHSLPAVGGLDFTPDGTRLTVADQVVRSWDVTTGEEVASYDSGEALDVSHHPTQDVLAVGRLEGFIDLWDSTTGTLLDTLAAPRSAAVDNVTFDTAGERLAITDRAGFVHVLDASTGQELLSLPAPGVVELHFTSDGTGLVAGTTTGSALHWDLTPTGARDLAAFMVPQQAAVDLAFADAGTSIVAAGFDLGPTLSGAVHRFALSDGRADVLLAVEDGAPSTLVDHGDGLAVIVGQRPDGNTIVADLENGDELLLRDLDLIVDGAARSSDGSLVATAGFSFGQARMDPTIVRVWDAVTGELMHELEGHEGDVHAIDFAPVGELLASASQDETAIVWDAATGEQVARLRGHGDNVDAVRFRPDGSEVVTAGTDATIRRWDPRTGREVGVLSGHTAAVLGLGFLDPDTLVSASSDGTLRTWDLPTGEPSQQLPMPTGLSSFAVDAANRHVAVVDFFDPVVHVFTFDGTELLAAAEQRVTRSLPRGECERLLFELEEVVAGTTDRLCDG